MGYLCDRLVVLGVSIVGGKILTVVESMFHECLGDHHKARVFVRPQLIDYLDRLAAGLKVMGGSSSCAWEERGTTQELGGDWGIFLVCVGRTIDYVGASQPSRDLPRVRGKNSS